jgi:hypothetical protein
MTLFAFLFAIQPSFGFVIQTNSVGDELYWGDTEIFYSINTSGDHNIASNTIIEMTHAAAREWDTVRGSDIMFQYDGETDIDEARFEDNQNVIYFLDEWDEDPDRLAVTTVWSTPEGEIVGFDMAINAEHYDWGTLGQDDTADLMNSLVHELGHALGIGHSDSEDATMYPDTHSGDIEKRDLARDDMEALLYLYPVLLDDSSNESVTLNCSSTGTAQPLQAGLFLALAGLVVTGRRRQEAQ